MNSGPSSQNYGDSRDNTAANGDEREIEEVHLHDLDDQGRPLPERANISLVVYDENFGVLVNYTGGGDEEFFAALEESRVEREFDQFEDIKNQVGLDCITADGADGRKMLHIGQDVSRRDFSGLELQKTNFTRAIFSTSGGKTRTSFEGADLQGASFRELFMPGINFSDADLSPYRLSNNQMLLSRLDNIVADKGNFYNCTLTEAIMREGSFNGAWFSRAILTSCDLSSAKLRYAHFDDADLEKAILRGADLRKADLTNANLRGADLSGADLTGAILTGVIIDTETILPESAPEELLKRLNLLIKLSQPVQVTSALERLKMLIEKIEEYQVSNDGS